MHTEPSGILLMRLINTRILDIARLESSDGSRLRLYGTGGWWTAFDRSAFALSRFFPRAESLVVTPPGCPFSVVGLTVSDRQLKKFMKDRRAVVEDVDYVEFEGETLDSDAYDNWYNKIVKTYKY